MALNWTEGFGFHRATVGRMGDIEVGYVDGAYQVRVFGMKLKTPSPTVDDGKRRAVEAARKLLAEAAAALETETV